MEPRATTERNVALAARAIARHGLAHAYGHVSGRIDEHTFLVTGPQPLGRTKLGAPLVVCPIEGELAAGALPEVRIHQEVYRTRPEVGGICRFQSPHVLALSAVGKTPRALHGLGTYFAPSAPLWDDPALVRDPERAAAVVKLLGTARAVVLRGNGAVTVGPSVREAACHAFCLEDAARLELAVLATGQSPLPYTDEQAKKRGAGDQNLYDRMWDYLLGEDAPEATS
jgi:HCOMODA/2-hydroxy-3-carboxy-muconic semialdehyde decarboxylase